MANVHDVAAYILRQQGPMTAMKLQKLVFYAHAWHLVWEERSLSDATFEAWANGPVSRDLYRQHRGNFRVATWPVGDADRLAESERTTIDAVLAFYGPMSAHQLSELTHSERPWTDARQGLPDGVRGSEVITESAMFEYYDSLTTRS